MPSSWTREWNDIIRYVIFPDEGLKFLMKLPENTTIINFINKYFMRVGTVSEPLKDEVVRIVYGNYGSALANDVHVLKQEISFDIYVQTKQLHNVGEDRLVYRTELIAERLKDLLTRSDPELLGGYHFRCIGESDMNTSTIGYVRYNVTFQYMRTV